MVDICETLYKVIELTRKGSQRRDWDQTKEICSLASGSKMAVQNPVVGLAHAWSILMSSVQVSPLISEFPLQDLRENLTPPTGWFGGSIALLSCY